MTALRPAGLASPLSRPPAPVGWGDRLARGWRGPAFAAAVACAGALPGLLALPPVDRDESRTAQASTRMLEAGDVRSTGEPPAVYWLQAAAVRGFSTPEARDIRVYRLPSLLGAMLAAAACAWGAAAFLPAGAAALAGALLGSGLTLSAEGFLAGPEALLCGATTLALASLGRLYAQARRGVAAPPGTRPALWAGLTLSVLAAGPAGPVGLAATLLTLAAADRDTRWMRRIGWGWGLALLLLAAGPWAAAATVATDGSAWAGGGGREKWPTRELWVLLAPALAVPGLLLLPTAAVAAWRRRGEPGVRFALAWLIPSGLIFAALRPALGPPVLGAALAWLAAMGLAEARSSRAARGLGGALALSAALVLAATALGASRWLGASAAATALAAGVAALALAAATAGGALLVLRRPAAGLLAAMAATLAAHGVAAAAWLPRLDALWVSQRAARMVARAGLDPRNGVTPGPVAVTGYAEPSLVFALGTATELDSPEDAAISVAAGQPALVEARQDTAFLAALARDGAAADRVGSVSGFDYAAGRRVTLTLWRSRS